VGIASVGVFVLAALIGSFGMIGSFGLIVLVVLVTRAIHCLRGIIAVGGLASLILTHRRRAGARCFTVVAVCVGRAVVTGFACMTVVACMSRVACVLVGLAFEWGFMCW